MGTSEAFDHALAAVSTTRARRADGEPIAVIGLSCRLPGAAGPAAFWRLLSEGRGAVTPVPADREPVGGAWGAFVEGVDLFDAGFFGIPPREAAVLDPQQRLMLELAWEAVEDARIAAVQLRGTQTGVFVGAMRDDYAFLLGRHGAQAVNHHTMPAVSRGVIANRVSYFLGLEGPSLVIDAGQASSLVAVHAAAESLRRGESALAIAGGVNLNLAAETGLVAEEFGGLSPDGRCYTFDARANGFVRGEGGVALLLKPLAAAVADGDRVYGVILGGAVNNDGATDGLTVPSQRAQEAVLRRAYESAAIAPADVQYVELHGTGTPVGDPIEAAALGRVLGEARGREQAGPLLVGSVKTNIGHLESAAGAAGLLKTILAMAHGSIPASLNFERPNPRIPLDELNLDVVHRPTAWPDAAGPRIAGVSAFGMGGTNCHLVLSRPPESVAAESAARRPLPVMPWTVSARSAAGLRAAASALRTMADTADPADVGSSLISTRSTFEHRAVILGDHKGGLSALRDGEPAHNVVSGAVGDVGRTVFVFPGQGAQWTGMAVELLDSSPVFAARIAECERALSQFVDWSLTGVLRGADGSPSLDRVDVVQPASFAAMVALAELWRWLGVEPAAVVGHSQGEIAAACVAGVLSLEDAARVVVARSRLVAGLGGGGAMVSVSAPLAQIRELLGGDTRASVAVVNAPQQVVLSGDADAIDQAVAVFESAGVRARRIAVDYASHSPQMDQLRDALLDQLAPVMPGPGTVPMFSTVTGGFVDPLTLDAQYWFRNLREPVRFADAVAGLAEAGHGVFVECSSHPVLVTALAECAPDAVTVGSLRRDDGGLGRFLSGVGELWVRGVPVDWHRLFEGGGARTVDLPTYAFQRERHWFDSVAQDTDAQRAEDGIALIRLSQAGEDEKRRILLDLVRGHTAAVLGHRDAAAIPARVAFRDLGFDSQSSLRLRQVIRDVLRIELPTTVLFDHPTPARLAEHLHTLNISTSAGSAAERRTAPARSRKTPSDEPIAIIGMGCRFPGGVRSPEQLWQLVASGTDAISQFPADRGWDLGRLLSDPRLPGSSATRYGGFIHDAGDFDPDFFGISPREALAMDPQQRLLLECSWEALERAGIDPSGLDGSRTGVFVGAMTQEYGPRLYDATDGLEGYALTGTTGSTMSGRIAYVLGLEGPALTVDTACSASLVAIHLAAQSLRGGECSLALAGAATVMARPGIFVEFSRQHGLSADGRCKAFSDSADGTGWSEGAGTVVLERLSDARRNGHRVLAVLAGTAVNSDGASNGLTAPNGLAQQRVIRQALDNAGLRPSDVDAVEAHGTGTTLGDPVEAQALVAVYGQDRPADRPLWLGSLKSNIGHTQAAAGMGGLMKMVLALQHGRLPRTLHADRPSSHVDWSAGNVRLLTEAVPWPAGAGPRRAGVSAFGISGTNTHVIVAEAPETVDVSGDGRHESPGTNGRPESQPSGHKRRTLPYTLSARTAPALSEQARRLRRRLNGDEAASPADLAYSLAAGRARFAQRAVILASDGAELDQALSALADAGTEIADLPDNVLRAMPAGDDRVVFLFPGQGGQWPGMATRLLGESPVFAARMAECEHALSEFVDWSLTDVLRGAEGAPPLDRVDIVQPALFAVMVSLAELWQSYGVRPAAVVGHSQGEIAAACVAGALSLQDAARVVALRSRAILKLAGRGTMASVSQPVERVAELAGRWEGRISVAAVNGPRTTVVSGEPDAVAELLAQCERDGVHARSIPVDYASHSAHVETIQGDLAELLAPIGPRRAEVPFHSTVTATALDGTELTGDYWYRNLRGTVRFEEATRRLVESGHRIFVELGPHPTLGFAVRDTLEDAGAADGVAIGTLRRQDGGLDRFTASLAEAHVHGVEPDWSAVFAGAGARVVDLPTYPFERERYWWSEPDRAASGPLGVVKPAVANQCYEIAWRPMPDDDADTAAGTLSGDWLVVAGKSVTAGESYREVVAALRDAGAHVTRLTLPDGAVGHNTLPRALAPVATGRPAIAGVLSLLALDESSGPSVAVGGVVALLRSLEDAGIAAPVWCATQGAADVAPADPVVSPTQAAVWGIGRTAALEYPRTWGGLIDLPSSWNRRCRIRLAASLASVAGSGYEDQVAIRPGGSFARRLVRANRSSAGRSPWRPRGTVLVTGGTGALGRRLARWLASNGAERIVVTGRGGARTSELDQLTGELRESGVELVVAACDVTDRAALARLLDDVTAEPASGETTNPPLTAVFHAAGVCELGSLRAFESTRLSAVMDAKAEGAVNLDELLADRRLDAFVLFSSTSGTWGVVDHGVYGAANACLDALAAQRRSRGLAATSIAWGPWGGGGMIEPDRYESLAATGIPVLDPDRAFEGLQFVLDHDETAIVVADVNWDRFGPVFTTSRPSPLLAELATVSHADTDVAAKSRESAAPESALATRLAPLPRERRLEAVLDLVREHTARVLRHSRPQAVEAGRAFRDLGLDSLTAVELRDRLAAATGIRLPAAVVFDHPTAALLAEHLLGEVHGHLPEAADPAAFAAVAGDEIAPAVADDPIAIVGMACRLPGAISGPRSFWRMLEAGGEGVGPLPGDRGWDLDGLYDPDPDRHGFSYVRAGGFLDRAADFDHEFFGISGREALAMDPQQRLLLEASWEAFEGAGLVPAELKGTDTGVFVGALAPDYGVGPDALPGELEGYRVTGGAPSVASGRLAYNFGFVGPAVTIDTACSSSLVALHLAGQALRDGECRLAVVAGAAVMATPGPMIGFSRQRALSSDGRCRSFAEAADGFGMSEGVAVLLVERLSEARRAGHRVLAVVRGSAVNQDGASNGLTAPNGPSQQRVIWQALRRSGLRPGDVDAVEAHGTGTRLGDPIEAEALLATYGADRPQDRALWLGSAKSNLGHTQAAAGLVGVIKMVLALQHGLLPRTLHAEEPTSRVDWTRGGIRLLAEPVPWPRVDGRPRRAGVSAFGISGTNAHVIVEESPEPTADETAARLEAAPPVVPWVMSARNAAALQDQASALSAVADGAEPVDVGWSLISTRSRLEHRAVVLGDHSRTLAALAAGEPADAVVRGEAGAAGRTVFVFPGQGAQWAGMAAGLLDSSPVFAARIAECERALSEFVDWSLTDVLRGIDGAPSLDRVDVVQPASFAVMVALAELWRWYGVEPAAVVGHSQGEIAAACVAGALSLHDAARVVCLRSKALTGLSRDGGMASVALPPDQVKALLSGFGDRLSVAAVNGPGSVVLSGDRDAIEDLVERCGRREVRARVLPVDYASHSTHVEPILPQLAELLAPVRSERPRIPMFSTVTGDWIGDESLDADYWSTNLRQQVRFADAVRALGDQGFGVFVECSAHPVLLAAIEDCLAEHDDVDVIAVGSLRRDEGGADRFVRSLAQAWVRGAPVDWTRCFGDGPHRVVELPTYRFQRRRHWIEPRSASARGARPMAIDDWRYRVQWRAVPAGGTTALFGDWIVVTPDAAVQPDLVNAVINTLTLSGATVHRLTAAELCEPGAKTPSVVAGVLSLVALDERPHPDEASVTVGLADTVAVVRALAAIDPDAPLWTATCGAVSTSERDAIRNPLQATAWGMGVVLGLDESTRWCGQLDLPAQLDADAADRLAAALAGGTGESELAVRHDGLWGRRLLPAPARPAEPWRPRGTVLITGGTGALGAHVARWAAERGAAHLVLTSRSGVDAPGAQDLRAQLAELGARVTIERCDVADVDALAAVLAAIPADEPLTAVVHAAGITQPQIPIGELSLGDLAGVTRVKVDGARNLDALLADTDLDAFVLFSSGAGTWGDAGKGGYAAANAYLDALAHARRARGLPATSIAWGAWAGGGMVEGEVAELLAKRGVRRMRPESALEAMAVAVGQPDVSVAIASLDLDRFLPLYTMARPRRLVAELAATHEARTANRDGAGRPDQPAPDGAGTGSAFADRLTGLPTARQDEIVLDVVRREAATVLKARAASEIRPRRAFKELGFDSLTALEFRNRLSAATGLKLPATLVFDHPTPALLAAQLRERLTGGTDGLLAELERVEATVAALAAGERIRGDVVDRLRVLLHLAAGPEAGNGMNGIDGTNGMAGAGHDGDLAAASDDEIFDLIDRELGIS